MNRESFRKPALALTLIAGVIAADQFTKHLARQHLTTDRFDAIHESYPACTGDTRERDRKRLLRSHGRAQRVIPMFFELRYAENCASSFNALLAAPEWFRYPFFILTSLAALAAGAVFLFKRTSRRSTALGWALFLGGTAGNLIDRLTHRYVIDFLDFYLVIGGGVWSWPTFNLADVAITAGALLLAVSLWRAMKDESTKETPAPN